MIPLLILISSLAFSFASEDLFRTQWIKSLHKENQKNKAFWFTGSAENPDLELKATISAFNAKVNFNSNDHAQCLYPARRMLIESYLGSNLFPHSKCPDYDHWIDRLNPQGVSVVFAGNYPDNPGSLFGHTFLKFNTTQVKENKLLDYALNFSADVRDKIGVLYAVKGLLGGYFGWFSLDPYFMKVNEYNEAEGRDIWEYETTLTPEQARLILAHVWELRQRAQFRYYFLSDNCSYFILNLLDFAQPKREFEKHIPWYVIPLETVKVLHHSSDMVRKTTYRPSVRLRAQHAFTQLSFKEQNEVKDILRPNAVVTSEKNPRTLKVAAMQIAAIHSRKDGVLPQDLAEKEENILLRLSELSYTSSIKKNELPSPHNGHDITQVSLGTIHDGRTALLLGYRPGVHDLNDYAEGYLPYSELSILDTSIRVENKKLEFQKIDLLSITLLRPWTVNEREWSWSSKITYQGSSQLFAKNEEKILGEALMGLASVSQDALLLGLLGGAYYNGGELNLEQSMGLMSQAHLIWNEENWKSVNGIKFYHDINHTQDHAFQPVPYSNLAFHVGPNLDYQAKFVWPLYVKGLNRNPAQLTLEIEHHF